MILLKTHRSEGQTCVLGDTRQHARADLVVVKGKNEVRPVGT